MAGDDSTATVQAIQSLLRDVAQTSATGFKGRFKKDCTDLSRRVALLSHLFEEIRDFQGDRSPMHLACSSSSLSPPLSQLMAALKAATILLQFAGGADRIISHESAMVDFTSEFRRVTCKLEKALADFPYGDYEISVDVKEQVDFVKGQLIRAAQRYETINIDDDGVESKVTDLTTRNLPLKAIDELEDSVIPDDFLCPISRELFRDPVMVSTGQTYERSYIKRWIKSGYKTCPKSSKKLRNRTLIPNYVLRSLIAQWCTDHNVEQPTLPIKIKRVGGKPRKNKRQAMTNFEFTVLLLLCMFCWFCFIISRRYR